MCFLIVSQDRILRPFVYFSLGVFDNFDSLLNNRPSSEYNPLYNEISNILAGDDAFEPLKEIIGHYGIGLEGEFFRASFIEGADDFRAGLLLDSLIKDLGIGRLGSNIFTLHTDFPSEERIYWRVPHLPRMLNSNQVESESFTGQQTVSI